MRISIKAQQEEGEALRGYLWSQKSLCGKSLKSPGTKTGRCGSLLHIFSSLHSKERIIKSKGKDAVMQLLRGEGKIKAEGAGTGQENKRRTDTSLIPISRCKGRKGRWWGLTLYLV